MAQMILEPTLRSRFGQSESEVELRDEQGELVGYFVPPPLHRELILAWSRSHVSEDDLEVARREPAGRPLADILKDLDQR